MYEINICQLHTMNQMMKVNEHIVHEPTKCSQSAFSAEGAPPGQKAWNAAMKRVRISIEWNYGYTATLFKYIQNHSKLKVMQSKNVAKVYTVATLFRNFHVAAYGGQTSNYFDLTTNFLAAYINQTDI